MAQVLNSANLDVYRSAAVLILEHGEKAASEAAEQADRVLDTGDVAGWQVWLRILATVAEFQKTSLQDGDVVH